MPKIRDAKQMIDMAEKGDQKDKSMQMPINVVKSKGPAYPYGLRITLNKDQLAKMKISPKDMAVGDKVDISALAKVVRISESASDEYEDKSIELQITKMAVV